MATFKISVQDAIKIRFDGLSEHDKAHLGLVLIRLADEVKHTITVETTSDRCFVSYPTGEVTRKELQHLAELITSAAPEFTEIEE